MGSTGIERTGGLCQQNKFHVTMLSNIFHG
jgi:hypothetical protein